MKSQPIQLFKSTPFVDLLPVKSGSVATWEGPRLTMMYPVEGKPAGSDRAVCHTVNGLLRVRVNDHALFDPDATVTVIAGLWGEYGGVANLIQSTSYPLNRFIDGLGAETIDPLSKYYQVGTDFLTFDVWNTFSNLAQNIFIRLSFLRDTRYQEPESPIIVQPTPINVTLSGVLIGSDLG
jgi:hypothetical protein